MENQTVIVVNDDPAILGLLDDVLSDEGYHVLTAEGRRGALELISAAQPCLVILDLRMQRADDGLKVLGDLARLRETRDIPVIICSAEATQRRAEIAAVGHPSCSLLPKPFDLDDLLAAVAGARRQA